MLAWYVCDMCVCFYYIMTYIISTIAHFPLLHMNGPHERTDGREESPRGDGLHTWVAPRLIQHPRPTLAVSFHLIHTPRAPLTSAISLFS
jgi:hypothetical protein